ncbi:MAG: hypothetical protein V3V20_02875 [Algisphaera sp.]
MNTTTSLKTDTPSTTQWLALAREAGDGDLGRGIRMLALTASAVHREQSARFAASTHDAKGGAA